MAKLVTAKKIGRQGSTPGNRVTYQVWGANDHLEDSDFVFQFDFDPQLPGRQNVDVTFNPRLIETVMNVGPSPVEINGRSFETGRWELSLVGGMPTDSDSIVVNFDTPAEGNVFLEIRS